MRFLDTNVVIDLLGHAGTAAAHWSRRAYARAAGEGGAVCNLVVVAEVAADALDGGKLMRRLAELEIGILDLTPDAAFRAADAFRRYRARGGPRTTILADFLIAGHADAIGATFVTRDRRLASYFPGLALVTPETHPDD